MEITKIPFILGVMVVCLGSPVLAQQGAGERAGDQIAVEPDKSQIMGWSHLPAYSLLIPPVDIGTKHNNPAIVKTLNLSAISASQLPVWGTLIAPNCSSYVYWAGQTEGQMQSFFNDRADFCRKWEHLPQKVQLQFGRGSESGQENRLDTMKIGTYATTRRLASMPIDPRKSTPPSTGDMSNKSAPGHLIFIRQSESSAVDRCRALAQGFFEAVEQELRRTMSEPLLDCVTQIANEQ